MALNLPETDESAHMGHPDFRVGDKILATLAYPDKKTGMVKLTPERQRIYVQAHPNVFAPAQGAWGLAGSTMVHLKDADPEVVGEALRAAWLARAPKKLTRWTC
jgi:hypothetical protein